LSVLTDRMSTFSKVVSRRTDYLEELLIAGFSKVHVLSLNHW